MWWVFQLIEHGGNDAGLLTVSPERPSIFCLIGGTLALRALDHHWRHFDHHEASCHQAHAMGSPHIGVLSASHSWTQLLNYFTLGARYVSEEASRWSWIPLFQPASHAGHSCPPSWGCRHCRAGTSHSCCFLFEFLTHGEHEHNKMAVA